MWCVVVSWWIDGMDIVCGVLGWLSSNVYVFLLGIMLFG